MVEIATSSKRLLVVDDDHLICWALEQEFSADDLPVSICHDGKNALARIHAAPYDLVFLDVHLPDANGIEILEEIKKLSPGTRVIVMSGDAGTDTVRKAIAEGAEQFIEKPFDPSMIRGRVLGMFRDYPVPRKHPRYICRIPVRISLLAPLPPGAGLDLDNLGGVAEEVGAGGVRVATQYPLATGQVVRVRTGVPGPADAFVHLIPPNSTAEVRWMALAPEGFRAGLSFTKPRVVPQGA